MRFTRNFSYQTLFLPKLCCSKNGVLELFLWTKPADFFTGHSTVDGDPLTKISEFLVNKNISKHFLQKTRAEIDSFSQKSAKF